MFNKKKLSEYLEREGLTYEEFGERVGITKMLVCYLVNGFRQPSASLLQRIADAMGCTMEDLMIH